jgi:hypothetical protein
MHHENGSLEVEALNSRNDEEPKGTDPFDSSAPQPFN